MTSQTEARIFLAEQRGASQTPDLHSYHTFNFGPYRAEGREPFGALCLLNDDILQAGASLSLGVDEPTSVVLLPITGGLEYRTEQTTDFLEPGQSVVLSLGAGMAYTVGNPYETEFINFLQIWLIHGETAFAPAVNVSTFDLSQKNTLLSFLDTTETGRRGYIGRYDGREEGAFVVGAGQNVFVFVLSGVFEVANRLLHARDGLALRYQQAAELDFEALSNEAVLLVIAV
ncbi:hypothetical protein [Spirosoma montaniterrae]|uniref:Quercetin 2,3-dioxygenase C-terminal cupin domain-containing protein n=1 Tax=Spirosoma montaniterrae TaxID=1178516 RepID=A0A1P9WY03_9BACT|nr:hypothetical protein [Spirosoma montaniterrae]AQG80251.1 hypothetical protein AWR27_13545 [Spirosoma montaniterrae]